MAWVKLDDQILRHHKIIDAGPAAAWLWACFIAHSQSQLTDGFISKKDVYIVGLTTQMSDQQAKINGHSRRKSTPDTHQNGVLTPAQKLAIDGLVTRLVDAKLLDKTKDGYKVHDYLDHNSSRSEVNARRHEEAKRKADSRAKNGHSPHADREKKKS